jgi:hypothetical protein
MKTEDWDKFISEDKEKWEAIKKEIHAQWSSDPLRLEKLLQELFDIAFKEGQQYVWYMRSGFGEAKNPDLQYTLTVTNGKEEFFTYEGGKFKKEEKQTDE